MGLGPVLEQQPHGEVEGHADDEGCSHRTGQRREGVQSPRHTFRHATDTEAQQVFLHSTQPALQRSRLSRPGAARSPNPPNDLISKKPDCSNRTTANRPTARRDVQDIRCKARMPQATPLTGPCSSKTRASKGMEIARPSATRTMTGRQRRPVTLRVKMTLVVVSPQGCSSDPGLASCGDHVTRHSNQENGRTPSDITPDRGLRAR